jgi:hypothetical protein
VLIVLMMRNGDVMVLSHISNYSWVLYVQSIAASVAACSAVALPLFTAELKCSDSRFMGLMFR